MAELVRGTLQLSLKMVVSARKLFQLFDDWTVDDQRSAICVVIAQQIGQEISIASVGLTAPRQVDSRDLGRRHKHPPVLTNQPIHQQPIPPCQVYFDVFEFVQY